MYDIIKLIINFNLPRKKFGYCLSLVNKQEIGSFVRI